MSWSEVSEGLACQIQNTARAGRKTPRNHHSCHVYISLFMGRNIHLLRPQSHGQRHGIPSGTSIAKIEDNGLREGAQSQSFPYKAPEPGQVNLLFLLYFVPSCGVKKSVILESESVCQFSFLHVFIGRKKSSLSVLHKLTSNFISRL